MVPGAIQDDCRAEAGRLDQPQELDARDCPCFEISELILLAASGALCARATSTPYQPIAYSGGYAEQKISENEGSYG
jgi:hypothetical protein